MHSLLYFEAVTLEISHPVVLGPLVLMLGHTCIPDIQTHLCFCQLPLPRSVFKEKNKNLKNPENQHINIYLIACGEGWGRERGCYQERW